MAEPVKRERVRLGLDFMFLLGQLIQHFPPDGDEKAFPAVFNRLVDVLEPGDADERN